MRSRLFRGASTATIFLVGAGLALASSRNAPEPAPRQAIHIRGRVLDRNTQQPLEAARLLLVPDKDNAWRTDSRGRFSFWIFAFRSSQIEIRCDGYEPVLVPVADGELHDIRLSPPRIPQNQEQLSGLADRDLLLPPSPSVAPAIMTADSGPKVSGAGKNWSDWYQLGVGEAPRGYTIEQAEFWLSGDRSCGASAECRQMRKNDHRVLWEFRLQGHDEPGAPSRTYSVAHIRVLYMLSNRAHAGTAPSAVRPSQVAGLNRRSGTEKR